MAQVKKLQAGQTVPVNTSTTPKKRLYRGVEITDEDINQYEQELGRWTRENTNNSGDLRKLDSHIKTIASELRNNADIELNPTGLTRVGSVSAAPGKRGTLGTDLNLFGNIRDEQGTALDKTTEFFDKLIEAKKTPTTESSTATPTQKYHSDLSRTISDRYFGGNWENAQKGIGELTSDKRLAYVKEGLKDSILKYKQTYGEDSKYSGKLAEIDKATPERIKEIAYEMGMDASEYLEGTAAEKAAAKQKTESEEIDTTSNLGKFLQSKGWKYVKDKDGKFKPVQGDNPSDLQEGIIKDFGEFYGYGLFKDSTGELKFGKKKDFEGTDLFGKANAAYSEIFAGNQSNIAKGLNSIDYNNYNNPLFTKLDKYRTNNIFDYYDLSNQFTGIQPNQRLYTPKAGIKFDDLGNIDVDNSELFLYDDSTQKLERINPNMSYNSNITAGKYNLGTIGTNPNTLNPLKNIQSTYRNTLNQQAPEFEANDISKAVNLLKGWGGATIGSSNALRFLSDAVNNKYASGSLDPHEKQLLANYMTRIFTKYVNKNAIGPQFMSSLQAKIDELSGNKTGNGTTSSFKKGGIIKAQVGAMISNQKTAPVKITKLSTLGKAPSQSVRMRDIGNSSTADKLDMLALAGDAASLAGGVVGIGGGVTATGAQLAADILRKESFATTASNLGINLGFTLLAAIPGLGLTKGAVKAAKVADKLNDAKKVLKNVENGEDILKQAKNVVKLAEKAEESKTGKKAFEKLFIKNQAILPKKESLNVATRVLATGGKGFVAGLGVTGALQSIPDIYKDVKEGGLGAIQTGDIRGTLGLVGVGKMTYGHFKKQALKGVTNPSSIFKAEPIEVNVKGVEGINKVKIDKYTNAKDLEPQIKVKVNAELDNKITQLKNSKNQTEETTKEIAKLESLKDKATLDIGWWNKQGKHLGNIKNSAKESTSNFWRDNIVNDLSKRTYNPEKLGSTKWMDKWGNKLAAKNGYLNFDEDVVEQSIKESVKKARKPRVKKTKPEPRPEIKKMLALPAGKFYNAKQKLGAISQSNSMYEMNTKPKSDRYGQLSMFKQGGQLIPKFQNEGVINNYISGQIIKGKKDDNKSKNLPEFTITAKDLSTKPKITTINKSLNISPKTTVSDSKKANLNLNTGILREIPKLANSLSTNAKNARIMASVKPVLAQMPTETYKPVVTNLANENFVNNQVTSYLRQASKPVTSDASLQKAIQLEALSKTTPMTIQARAANTDMYNQTLGASKESAEKYNLMRNEVANTNAERLGAHDARIASIYAGKNVANNASWGNFFDKSNQLLERDNMYKHQLNTQSELQRLQRERQDKLKPSYERYTNSVNDPKSTNIYKIAEKWNKEFPNKRLEDYTENGKTYSELLALEQANNQKAYESESEKLNPYYENQFLNLNYRNPYTRAFNIGTYKKGGSVDSKVEIQNLKNKMKAKEMDAKYADKALDRKQKEVKSILNGLSKESLFLLKTMLGK
jgi:hypothetical protein